MASDRYAGNPVAGPPTRPPPRRPDPIAMVWIGGIALAALAYLVGPDHFVAQALEALQRGATYVEDLAHNLTLAAVDVVRAAAVGLFGTFVVLSVMAINRTGRGRAGLVVIGVVFVLLVWGAVGEGPEANGRWLAALVLAALAAVAVTRRLSQGAWRPPAPPSR